MKSPFLLLIALFTTVGIVLAMQGIGMHNEVGVEEAKFHQLQTQYYSQSKQIRDAAETDSILNMELVAIQNYPSEIMRLKLVGVGKILTGIFFLLLGVLLALLMMPYKMAMIMKGKN